MVQHSSTPYPVMPSLFIGHGSPHNALSDNEFTKTWKTLAASFPKPKGILVISAHFTNREAKSEITALTANKHLTTIHDFYGFPEELYDVKYSPPPYEELLTLVTKTLLPYNVTHTHYFGLDHGAWSVLKQMYPDASVPVIAMSIDETLSLEEAVAFGNALRPLRDQGILILGSGNLVHNLYDLDWHGKAHEYAVTFDALVRDALLARDISTLTTIKNNPLTKKAHPTLEHYLPLLYILGASYDHEVPSFLCESIFAGSISMRCVAYGVNEVKGAS